MGVDIASLVLAVDSTQVDKGTASLTALEQAGGNAESSIKLLATAGLALAAAFVATATAVAALVRSNINHADAMNDIHLKTGIALKDLAAYELLAKQSGSSIEGVSQGFKFLGKSLVDNKDELKALGVTSADTSVAMGQFADLIASINDPALRTTVAMKYLGRSGVELIPTLIGGSTAFKEAKTNTSEYGKELERAAPLADAFNDKIEILKTSGKTFGMSLANEVLPIFNMLIDDFSNAKEGPDKFASSLKLLEPIVKGVALAIGNVAFVLKAMGTEIGGMAAQVVALANGNLTAFRAIGDAMKEDAEKSRANFDAWEKKLLDFSAASASAAKAEGEGQKKLTKEAEAAIQARVSLSQKQLDKQKEMLLVHQKEEEKRTMSFYAYNVKQLERWRDDQIKLAEGSSVLLTKIEEEFQTKLRNVSETGYSDVTEVHKAGNANIIAAAAASASARVSLETQAAGQVVAVWSQANAARAAQTGGAIMNQGTPGEFVSSWDANGKYIGDLGKTVSGSGALGNAYSSDGRRRLSIAEELSMLNGYGHYATGGSFMVGGAGGTDTTPVGFMATPGELVTIQTPEQQRITQNDQRSQITIENLNLPGISNARQFVEELRQMLRVEPNLLSVGRRAG